MRIICLTGPEISGDEPSVVHKTIAKYQCPVITMCTDNFHQEAGSEEVVELRYVGDDRTQNAGPALALIKNMQPGDQLMTIGITLEDRFVRQLVETALSNGHQILTVDGSYEERVPLVLRGEYKKAEADKNG